MLAVQSYQLACFPRKQYFNGWPVFICEPSALQNTNKIFNVAVEICMCLSIPQYSYFRKLQAEHVLFQTHFLLLFSCAMT